MAIARCGAPVSRIVRDVADLDALFEEAVELLVWSREPLSDASLAPLESRAPGARLLRVAPHGQRATVEDWLGLPDPGPARALWESVEVFGDLTGAAEIGIRLAVTSDSTCPRMHVDRVALRACCTWVGPGTQWVDPAYVADRARLGHGAGGRDDLVSGLLVSDAVLEEVPRFAVAFFKGEAWPGMAGRGVVHRSPPPHGAKRVMWTLDALMTP
ncbi:MAG: DUF1826 domain-containing protein [Sandaracinaceae bacterium]